MKAIELDKKIKEGLKVKVFDIRVAEKYDRCHIEGAININKGELLSNVDKYIKKEDKAFVTCNGGSSSKVIAGSLKAQGYDIEFLEDGMNPMVAEFESVRSCSL